MAKSGASGDFHYVLLVNPNAAMELLRAQKKLNDDLYGRFTERLIEVGGYADILAVRAHWDELAKKAPAAAPAAAS